MTENQFYILIVTIGTGLTLVGGAIRWSASRLVSALEGNSEAMLANTKSNAVLSTKIDGIASYIERTTRSDTRKTNPALKVLKVKPEEDET